MGIILINYPINNFYILKYRINKVFRMCTDQNQQNWTIHSSMYQNKQKYRQLGASLLLTSSFAQHKEKANQQKRERLQTIVTNNIIYHHQVLRAKRINYEDNKSVFHQIDVSLSSIDQLKNHAKKLMDEKTNKLGKENLLEDPQIEPSIPTVQSQHIPESNFRINKKPNKRKIIKGRPQMYAVTKRRAFIRNLMQDDIQSKYPSKERSGRQKIKQLLNKNTLLKFISSTNEKAESRNLYDNFERHKTVEQVGKMNPQQKNNFHRTSLTMVRSCQKKNKLRTKLRQTSNNQSEPFKDYGFGLKKRRYSSIKTIQ